jgi:hypothetical protein
MHMSVLGLGRLCNHRTTIYIHSKTVRLWFDLILGIIGDQVHARWLLETSSATSCTLVVKVGVHFKRWCVMQSKIRAGTLNEYTADVEMAVKLAQRLLTNSRVNLQRDENP